MVKEKIPFKEQNNKSFKENLELFNRAKELKKRTLKLMKQEGENNK